MMKVKEKRDKEDEERTWRKR